MSHLDVQFYRPHLKRAIAFLIAKINHISGVRENVMFFFSR